MPPQQKVETYPNPWVWETTDYMNRVLRIEIPWDPVSHRIDKGKATIRVYRQPGCLWDTILWDDPSDPVKTRRSKPVPEGESILTLQQAFGTSSLQTIEAAVATQITAERSQQ